LKPLRSYISSQVDTKISGPHWYQDNRDYDTLRDGIHWPAMNAVLLYNAYDDIKLEDQVP
jgi:hypothetical protein